MRFIYAFIVIFSIQFDVAKAYAPPLPPRIITRPPSSSRHSFASNGSERVGSKLFLNGNQSEIGRLLFPVAQKRMNQTVVRYLTGKNDSLEEGERKKIWIRKYYDLTVGKLLAIFLHLTVSKF